MTDPTTIDRREGILVRLHELLGEISGFASTWRNLRQVDQTVPRPAGIVLDGKFRLVQTVVPQKTVKMPPAIFKLEPQIFVVLALRSDFTNLTLKDGTLAPPGPELSNWIDLINATVTNDPTLESLVTTNGQIVFTGGQTDMQSGSTIGSLGAQLRMDYEFYYPFFPPR